MSSFAITEKRKEKGHDPGWQHLPYQTLLRQTCTHEVAVVPCEFVTVKNDWRRP
jgi:hypothetical protein